MKIRSYYANWLLAASIVVINKIIFRTVRIQLIAEDPGTSPYLKDTTESYIYCVWHDSIAFPMFAGRHVRTVALVSKHQDGSCLGIGLQMLHIGLVRGSSNRHGAPAMREMMRLPAGKHVVMTPDGPRGPRRRIKSGLVFLGSRTGRSIVPTAFAASRMWSLPGSWTNLYIPKPFSTAYALTGTPIAIPEGIDRDELLEYENQVQAEMDRLASLVEERIRVPKRAAQKAESRRQYDEPTAASA